MSHNIYIYALLVILYISFGAILMNKYRKEELKANPPWVGKSGIEREVVVFGEIMVTPFVMFFRVIFSFSQKPHEGSEQKK